MKITESDLDITKLAISEEQIADVRSAGLHVSQIIRHITTTAGLVKDSGFTEDDLSWFALVGRLWERVLADCFYSSPRYIRTGEVNRDSIAGSPDAIDTEQWAIAEFKVTWQSSKEFQKRQKFREYIWQVASYCHMTGMQRADITVLHICGDYRPPRPCAKLYRILFTMADLHQYWNMMITGAREIELKGSKQ